MITKRKSEARIIDKTHSKYIMILIIIVILPSFLLFAFYYYVFFINMKNSILGIIGAVSQVLFLILFVLFFLSWAPLMIFKEGYCIGGILNFYYLIKSEINIVPWNEVEKIEIIQRFPQDPSRDSIERIIFYKKNGIKEDTGVSGNPKEFLEIIISTAPNRTTKDIKRVIKKWN